MVRIISTKDNSSITIGLHPVDLLPLDLEESYAKIRLGNDTTVKHIENLSYDKERKITELICKTYNTQIEGNTVIVPKGKFILSLWDAYERQI
ncbi:MAG: hypothetical protein KBS62_03415 [Oscillospiraceae bacterium]|nr:hypothetical protein [Candidatus Ruminococcus equi]